MLDEAIRKTSNSDDDVNSVGDGVVVGDGDVDRGEGRGDDDNDDGQRDFIWV